MPNGARSSSVKDVAALAGVSLGTVSNVLNRPERVSASTRDRVERAMADLGFVRNESARQLRAGTQPDARLRDARRRQPVLHRRGARASRSRPRPPTCRCCSATATSAPSARPRTSTCSSSSGCRASWSPRSTPRPPLLDEIRRRGTPVVIVDRDPRRPVLLLGRRSTTCSAAGSPSSTSSTAGTAGSRSSAGRSSLGQVRERLRGRPRGVGRGRAAGRDLVVVETESLDVASGREAGERLAGLPAGRRPTAAFCANDLIALGLLQHAIGIGVRVPERPRDRRLRRHRLRRGRRRPAHLGPPAAARARPHRRRAASSTSRATPSTSTGRCCSPPSWWRASPPGVRRRRFCDAADP